jgi:hypothetical protein
VSALRDVADHAKGLEIQLHYIAPQLADDPQLHGVIRAQADPPEHTMRALLAKRRAARNAVLAAEKALKSLSDAYRKADPS